MKSVFSILATVIAVSLFLLTVPEWHVLCVCSCAYLLSVWVLWVRACSALLSLVKSGCLFSYCGILSFLCIIWTEFFSFWIQVPNQKYDLQIFSPILWVVFSVSWWCPLKDKIFSFEKDLFLSSFLLWLAALVWYLRNHWGDFPGGPLIKTLCFHCWGRGFDPWSRN